MLFRLRLTKKQKMEICVQLWFFSRSPIETDSQGHLYRLLIMIPLYKSNVIQDFIKT